MKLSDGLFVQTSPHRLEIKKGGGCLSLFGVPFFGAGVFMLLITLRIIPLSNANEMQWWSWLVLAFMGLVFTGVGGVLVFGREWLSIDRTQNRIWIARGLLVPMRGTSYDLMDYSGIHLQYNPGDSDTAERFPVSLVSATDSRELLLINAVTYKDARDQALLLKDFLDFPVTDFSTDHPEELHPKTATSPQQLGEKPIAPGILNCDIRESPEELSLALKGAKPKVGSIVFAFIPAILFGLFGFRFFRFMLQTNTPYGVRAVFTGFFFVFFLFIPLVQLVKRFILARIYTHHLRINPRGVEFEFKSLSKSRKMLIPWAKVYGVDFSTRESRINSASPPGRGYGWQTTSKPGSEPIVYAPNWARHLSGFVPSKGLIFKTAEGLHYFGAGLPDEELVYLHQLVQGAVVQFKAGN